MEQLSCGKRLQRPGSFHHSRTQLMDCKRCSNGKEMIKEHFLTAFHNMNSTTLLRLTGQFKAKKPGKTLSQNTFLQRGAHCHRGLWRPKGLKGLEKFIKNRFHQGLINPVTWTQLPAWEALELLLETWRTFQQKGSSLHFLESFLSFPYPTQASTPEEPFLDPVGAV